LKYIDNGKKEDEIDELNQLKKLLQKNRKFL